MDYVGVKFHNVVPMWFEIKLEQVKYFHFKDVNSRKNEMKSTTYLY
jgi:hypothetical protein